MFSQLMNQVQSFTNGTKEASYVTPSGLGYGTNNKYPAFPPLMSDGRAVTASWQSEATVNQHLKESNNIQTNWQYRRYMTQNADSIREYNFKESCNDTGYYKRPIDMSSINSNMVQPLNNPHLYSSVEDETKPFGHIESDLKTRYLSREELQSRRIAPSIHKEQVLDATAK